MLKYLWTTRFQILKRFFCEFLENFCRIILIENFSKKNVWKCMVLKSFRFSYYIDTMLLYHNTLFHCAKILYFYPKIYRGKSNFRVKISVTNVNFSTKYRKFCHFVQYHLLAFRHVEETKITLICIFFHLFCSWKQTTKSIFLVQIIVQKIVWGLLWFFFNDFSNENYSSTYMYFFFKPKNWVVYLIPLELPSVNDGAFAIFFVFGCVRVRNCFSLYFTALQ